MSQFGSSEFRKKNSHAAFKTFILYVQVIWEMFPLHKNSNSCTFIEYSIFQEWAQLWADGTDSWLSVRSGPWPAAMPIPGERRIYGSH